MGRRGLLWAGAGVGFVLLLLYATLATSPPAPDPDAERRAAAERECARLVAARVPGARFPFAPTADAEVEGDPGAGGAYRLRGTVDAGPEGATVRRNYECLVRLAGPGAALVDSVRVWQSH